jgi:DNA-binding NarL/FixJ family response regulator
VLYTGRRYYFPDVREMKNTITVLIADDHTIVRDGLSMLLSAEPDIQVVAEALNGEEAVAQTRQLAPDVAVLDLAMPKLNGIEAARQIRHTNPDTQVVILSMYSDDEYVLEAVGAGISGYIVKQSASTTLLEAVRAVHSGQAYFSPQVSKAVLEAATKRLAPRSSPEVKLSLREIEVLRYIARGLSTKEIADKLFLSSRTVEKHRYNLKKKLNIRDVAGLTRYAIEKGIVSKSKSNQK